jgi:hypothetical protein
LLLHGVGDSPGLGGALLDGGDMLIDPRAVALHEPVEQSAELGLAGGGADIDLAGAHSPAVGEEVEDIVDGAARPWLDGGGVDSDDDLDLAERGGGVEDGAGAGCEALLAGGGDIDACVVAVGDGDEDAGRAEREGQQQGRGGEPTEALWGGGHRHLLEPRAVCARARNQAQPAKK